MSDHSFLIDTEIFGNAVQAVVAYTYTPSDQAVGMDADIEITAVSLRRWERQEWSLSGARLGETATAHAIRGPKVERYLDLMAWMPGLAEDLRAEAWEHLRSETACDELAVA